MCGECAGSDADIVPAAIRILRLGPVAGDGRGRVSIADDFDELPADMAAAFRGERP